MMKANFHTILRRSITTLLCGFIFLISTSYAVDNKPTNPAYQDWYQVEVIIFAHITPQAYVSEAWPQIMPPKNFPGALQLTSATQTDSTADTVANSSSTSAPVAFRMLPAKDFVLDKQAKALAGKNGYEILIHTAWRQPLKKGTKASTIHLFGGDDYTDSTSYPPQLMWQIDGTLRLKRRHFIDANTDLYLNEPVTDLPEDANQSHFSFGSSPNFAHFRLKESQRMQRDEIHYFDHPLFGMLVMITPYK